MIIRIFILIKDVPFGADGVFEGMTMGRRAGTVFRSV
jgi:hypothetical protein